MFPILIIYLNKQREEGGEWALFQYFLALSQIISQH